MIKVNVSYISVWDVDGDIDSVIKALKDIKNYAKSEGYTNIFLEASYDEAYGDRTTGWDIMGEKVETQEEVDKRLSKRKKDLAKQEVNRKKSITNTMKSLSKEDQIDLMDKIAKDNGFTVMEIG